MHPNGSNSTNATAGPEANDVFGLAAWSEMLLVFGASAAVGALLGASVCLLMSRFAPSRRRGRHSTTAAMSSSPALGRGTFRPRGPSASSVALLRQSSVSSGYSKHGMALSIPLPRLNSMENPGANSPHGLARAAATTTFQPRPQARAPPVMQPMAQPASPCDKASDATAVTPLRARSTGPSVARLCGRTFYEPSHEATQVQRSEILSPTSPEFATTVQAAATRPGPASNREPGSERADAAGPDQGSSTETLPADYCMLPQESTTAERGRGGGRHEETIQNIRSELETRDYGLKPEFIRTL